MTSGEWDFFLDQSFELLHQCVMTKVWCAQMWRIQFVCCILFTATARWDPTLNLFDVPLFAEQTISSLLTMIFIFSTLFATNSTSLQSSVQYVLRKISFPTIVELLHLNNENLYETVERLEPDNWVHLNFRTLLFTTHLFHSGTIFLCWTFIK